MLLYIIFALLLPVAYWYLGGFSSKKHPFTPKPQNPTEPKPENSKQLYGTKPGVVPDNLDAIVIGSGIGGLTVAALLSKQGRRVLVLEQHDIAGGCCHSFEDGGFEFDTGIHYVGGMGDQHPSAMQNLLLLISNNKLEWSPMGDVYDTAVFNDSERYEFHKDFETTVKNLLKTFPDDEDKIRKYFARIRHASAISMFPMMMKVVPWYLVGIFKWWYGGEYAKIREKTIDQVLINELRMSEKLAHALCYLCGDYGLVPTDKGSFMAQALVHNHYVKGAAYYPKGGTGKIAETIIPTIESTGGKVLVKAKVTEILVKDGKAYGVVTNKGQKILSDLIISDAGIHNTYGKLMSQELRSSLGLEKILKKFEPSLNLPTSNLWIHPSYDISKNREKYMKDMDFNHAGFFISFPSCKDPTYAKRYPGKSCCIIITEAIYPWVEKFADLRVKQRGEEYEDFKDEIKLEFTKVLLKHVPQVKDSIAFFDVATPVTNEHYLGSYKGASYGLNWIPDQDQIKPQTPIENLYLTGQEMVCVGFTGAIAGGCLTYAAITGENILTKVAPKKNK